MKRLAIVVTVLLVGTACGGGASDTSSSDTSSPTTTTAPSTTSAPATSSTTASTSPTTTATSQDDAQVAGWSELIQSGAISVDVSSPEGGVNGPILVVAVTNTGDQELEVAIPCGLVFLPPPGEQRMMAIEPAATTVAPGSVAELAPYVVCIDPEEAAASAGASYSPGELAQDDLLTLAQCLCDKDLSAEIDPLTGGMELQFAVWAVAEGELPDVSDDLTQLSGAVGDLAGENLGLDPEDLAALEGTDLEATMAMIEQMMAMFTSGTSQWLDECGIDLDK